MGINKDFILYLFALCFGLIFLWLWFPYLLTLSIGFATAASFYSQNLAKGEISSKNGEAPVGKITQKTYSYQSPDDKTSLPTIKSITKTSSIGQRRSSGPKIEEIKDESHSITDVNRRYSKEYTVDEEENVKNINEIGRRTSDGSESTGKIITSILKSSKDNQWNVTGGTTVRRSSGTKVTEFPEDCVSSKLLKTETTTTTNIKSTVSDKDDVKKPLGRGDSVKALQHKFQQATEAANQSASRPYPPAGLILRSNSLQKNDDQNIMSSTMKQTNLERTDSKGRIQETKTREVITSSPVISTQVKTFEDSHTVKTSPVTVTTRITTAKGPVQEVTTTKVTEISSKSGATSFLDDNTKVTGVQDILTRMRNADLVTESGDTSEDAEARALLNKFLGASVILQGMEQGMRAVHSTTQAPSSAALVNQAEKQRVKDANVRIQEDDFDDICDEKQLRILLEACSDYEDRRKIRARLRTVMAEGKGADEINEFPPGVLGSSSFGDCRGVRLISNNGIDDSGTESGEEIRVLNPEAIQEVQSALSRLEDVIPGLDPSKRDAVTQLVNSLQTCLKIPPPNPPPVPPPRRFSNKKLRNRHTVGVTREELADARRWINENTLKRYSPQNVFGSSDSVVTKVFRPVKFQPPTPVIEEKVTIPQHLTRMVVLTTQYNKPLLHRAGCFMEPAPQNGILSFIQAETCSSTDRSASDTASLYDYDPSLALFTPEQTVQIAVHKAAINKQISREELRRRGSSEDGDVSSGDEESSNPPACRQELSSVQRLLQIAADDKITENGRFCAKTNRKLKMKRSNTIDIPKPAQFYDYSSDDYGASADEGVRKAFDDLSSTYGKEKKIIPPTFVPKTDNDLKFLAFLKQVNENNQPKVQTYNPSARGGKHWQNRFSRIKTAFEGDDVKHAPAASSAKLFWQNNQYDAYNSNKENRTLQTAQPKLPWTVKTEENGVVVGSLTVSKPGHVNHFKHAAISAFKPIEKKQTVVSPVSGASGSVKQIAAQKFSVTPTQDILTKPERNQKLPQTKNLFLNYNKNDHKTSQEIRDFPLNSNTSQKTYSTSYHAPIQDPKSRGSVTNSVSKFFNENIYPQKLEQPYCKDNQPVKMFNSKSEKKDSCFNTRAQIKAVEAQLSKEASRHALPSKAKSIECTLETVRSPLDKKSKECSSSQSWVRNEHFGHFNNLSNGITSTKDRVNQSSKSESYQYSPNSFYSKLPLENNHIASKYNKNNTEVNDHNLKPTQKCHKSPVNRHYFNELNTRNSSLSHFAAPTLISNEKPRLSLPENKLVRINDNAEKFMTLDLRVPISEEDSPLNVSSYRPYNESISAKERKQTVITPQVNTIPDKFTDYKVMDNMDYSSESPSNCYLLSPVESSAGCEPNNLINSPHFDKYALPSEDRLTPNENHQKSNISPNYSTYSHPSQNFNLFERISPTKLSPGYKPASNNVMPLSSYGPHSRSPSIKIEESNDALASPYLWQQDSMYQKEELSHGDSFCDDGERIEEKAVTRVMGQAQCQQAVTINNRTKRRYDSPQNIESELKLQLHQSARQKTLSPSFPNVLQKSESWHQMVKEQMHQAKQAPPLPKISKAKSSHSLAFPKQFEASINPECVSNKKITVSQYLAKQSTHSSKKHKQSSRPSQEKGNNKNEKSLDEDLDNVDEIFESIFQESNKKRISK